MLQAGCKYSVWLLCLSCICFAEPRFYNTFDTLNDDVYNRQFVFDAADSCQVDTTVDAIMVMRGWGYMFIKSLPFKGHYRILRTQRLDAEWENERLALQVYRRGRRFAKSYDPMRRMVLLERLNRKQ